MSVVNQLPCTLAQLDQRDRQVRIQSQIMGQVLKVSAVKNGLQLEFPYSKTLIEQLNVFISLEQTCCGFLNFTILKKNNKVNFDSFEFGNIQ